MQYYSNLKKVRKEKGLTQEQIAEYLGTTRQQIIKYETGKQEMTVGRFIKLADLYKVSLDHLAGRKFDT